MITRQQKYSNYNSQLICEAVLALLLFVASCNAPHHQPSGDEELLTLLDETKKHVVNNPQYADSAIMILLELLPRQQGEEKTANRSKLLKLIGITYDIKGKYDSAANYLYEASRLAEKIKDDTLQMSIYTNLGILQFELKNTDESIKYYRQALALAEQLRDSVMISHLLNNIGNTYMTLVHEYEKAVPYFEQCRIISAKINYPVAYQVAGVSLAQIYNELNEQDKALKAIKQLSEQYGPNIYADFTLGEIYFKEGDHKGAIMKWKELLDKQSDTREFELAVLKNIAEAYKTDNNPDSAIVYLEKMYTLQDSLHSLQATATVQDLKIAYETEKKELTISALEDEKRLMIWLGLAGGGVLLSGLAALFLLWRLTVQKRSIAEQQVVRLQQEKQLVATQAVLDGETQERFRLARDLHDGLGSMLTGVKLNLESMKSGMPVKSPGGDCFDKAMKILNDSMQELRRVAHHLMPESLSKYGLKQSISDFSDSVSLMKFNWYGEETRLEPKLEVMIYRTMHELVNNALKHSGASKILVEIIRATDTLHLTVQDDGCGFDPSSEFEGMGLANIRTRVTAYNGNLLIDSKTGVGTEINVELRINNYEPQ